ncbi:MAG TPA: GNAT family N-acetyltransferase [Micromonosporaceae bacterium]
MTLENLEDYYDAVPRRGARAEDFGPLTLFVREGEGWPFYARPTRSVSTAASVADVERVRVRQRELGIPESFEWVAETTPSLRAAVEASGLPVHEHPLMVLDSAAFATASVPMVRLLDPDDPALPSALAVAHLAFADSGTKIGDAGLQELAEAVAEHAGDGSAERMRDRIRSGQTVMAAAVTEDHMALCSGAHQPVGATTEIVGVGTLPSARRQGFGAAVTAALVADALGRGVETVFLSAGDEDVARIYGSLGFRRVGTALIAEA